MKARGQADWSFLIMRGAEQSVKQFTVKKRSLVATPVALLAIISGCFIGLKLQATSQIKELELQLAQLSEQYEQSHVQYNSIIETQQDTVNTLELQLQEAYKKQQAIDQKLLELTELENQLEQFITTYGTTTSLELDRQPKTSIFQSNSKTENEEKEAPLRSSSISQLSYQFSSNSSQLQSTQTEFTAKQLANYEAISNLPIEQITKVVDNFIEVMHYNLNKAGKIRENVDSFPNLWPSTAKMTTSGFGYRKDPFTQHIRFHAGIDIDGQHGDIIFSAGDGTVTEAGFHSAYGHYVVIEHTDQLKTLYGHLSSIDAKAGETVVKGERIGKMGSSGRSTGTHLHFQVMLNDQPVSPLKYLIKPNE